jgi:hypothetical protein
MSAYAEQSPDRNRRCESPLAPPISTFFEIAKARLQQGVTDEVSKRAIIAIELQLPGSR